MRSHTRHTGAAVVAAAAALALAAGLAGQASAETNPGDSADRSAYADRSGQPVAKHRITLITGDRVTVDAKGRFVALEPAKGREKIPVHISKAAGRTLVIPADAARLLADGTLDQRLFDITELSKSANLKAQKNGPKVIIGYRGTAATAKAEVRGAGTVSRTLKSLNAQAVQAPKNDATDLWNALTNGDRAASGIARIWLDGVRKVTLEKSVPQIGAPKAWASNYDGKGVKIAVLDSGVDSTHPDLKDQVVASKNFTGDPDAEDRIGHGTHVASTAAGTGAQSGGKHKGVAPGAKILNGKVFGSSGGGDESTIIAAMDWAAEQGAGVVNLSLGGSDTVGVDPLEAAVNRLSAEKNILFAVSSGNDGPNSVGSPGTADAALTVGAVDHQDRLAPFSSGGPRIGDGAIKPDVTAPGVGITAAASKGSADQSPPGYVGMSGTSMSAPHAAGAAAILRQRHPDWTYAQIKSAIAGSAKGGDYTALEQGSGRIQVDQAVKQSVVAEPVSVNFGTQQWPHTDDKPVTRQVTYRNLGTKPVTLSLSATAVDPQGRPAPAGFFKLDADKVTVPAGGTASVGLTADTRLGGTVEGAYSGFVTAMDGEQSVRTAAVVNREPESHDVTFRYLGRDGKGAKAHFGYLLGRSEGVAGKYIEASAADSSTVTIRVPKGSYALNSWVLEDALNVDKGSDWVAQPKLDITKDTTVTVDARTAKPVSVTVPDRAATLEHAIVGYDVKTGNSTQFLGAWLNSLANVRSAHLGPRTTDGSLRQQWDSHWAGDRGKQYSITAGGPVKQLATGYTKHYKTGDFATVTVRAGTSATGRQGAVNAVGWLPGTEMPWPSYPEEPNLPATRTLYLSTADGVKWDLNFAQFSGQGIGMVTEAEYSVDRKTSFKAGKKYSRTVNRAVFGPALTDGSGLFRTGDEISGSLPLFADAQRNPGRSLFTSVNTTLYRNGTKIGTNQDPLQGQEVFKVPAGKAEYRLTTSVKRSPEVAAASTRIDASWTFRSQHAAQETRLPASVVRFNADTDLNSRVPAGRKATVPVVVEGAAKGRNLKSLSVYVSYDQGKSWKKHEVKDGRITVKNPAKGKSISYRAVVVDKQNNTSTVSIHNAYYGR
ncbi:S8 family peptidase [Streptomyces sp. NPDC004726]